MRPSLRSLFIPFLGLALSIPACAIDESSNPTARCETDAECPAGRVCYRNYCILGETIDGGDRDAGMDTGADVGRDTAGCVATGEETCNGMDDDCNGTVDDIERVTCTNGELGLCATAHLVCPSDGGATPVCRRDAPPAAETCNGMDDDCDGTTDEQSARRCYPEGTDGCTLVAGRYVCRGACGAGVQACVDGAYGDCEQARTPSTEVCTTGADVAGDEDCDELIDEECTCAPGTPCFPGDVRQAGLGECNVGTLNCATNTCTGFGMPSDETCGNAMADNDCDGVEDNVPGTGEVCLDDTMLGVCRGGVTQCVEGGAVECVTPMSMMELCDGLDDDCDGTPDEDFDLMTDEANCGGCGNVCGEGLSCCGGECVDATSSDDFCSMEAGTCGAACADGTSCCGGGCSDPMTDEANCGACGNACDAGDSCCGGVCLDDDYDEDNCGGCGVTCDAGGATPNCCNGVCGTCTIMPSDCVGSTPDFCTDACTNFDSDENNCGGCGITCDAGDVCCDGSCVDSDPTHCGGSCADCGSDLCCNGACTARTASNCNACGTTCGSGTACCASGCSAPSTDEANCGTCGNACAGGQECSVGHCCDMGWAWCGGPECLNVQTDRLNCGACGNRCSNGVLGIGYQNCVAGECV